MKRDDEYLRELLVEFEARDDWLIVVAEHLNMSADERRRHYHVLLLCDAELLAPVAKSTYRITSAGHDFLEATRDAGIWAKTKEVVAREGGSATLDILKELATGLLRKQIEERTGLKL